MISAGELDAMRAEVVRTLPDACQVQRLTQVVDDVGGTTDTYAPVATVACRVAPSGNQPDERLIADRITARSAFTIVLPHDADVRESDRILATTLAQSYEVVGVLAPRSWATHVRAVCAREG